MGIFKKKNKKQEASNTTGCTLSDHHKTIMSIKDECDITSHKYISEMLNTNVAKTVLNSCDEDKIKYVMAFIEIFKKLDEDIMNTKRFVEHGTNTYTVFNSALYTTRVNLMYIFRSLLRKNIDYTEHELHSITSLLNSKVEISRWDDPFKEVLRICMKFSQKQELSDRVKKELIGVSLYLKEIPSSTYHKIYDAIDQLCGVSPEMGINPGEAWSDTALKSFELMAETLRNSWKKLIAHCKDVKGSSPTSKWLEDARKIIIDIGEANFKRSAIEWFSLVGKPRTVHKTRQNEWSSDPNYQIEEVHIDILKGMAWCCSLFEGVSRKICG